MKKLIALLLALTMVFATVGCAKEEAPAKTETPAAADQAETPASAAKDTKIAVVMHAMNSSFYTKLADGAKAAGKDLGITVDVTSPTTASNLAEQVNLLESVVAAEYDGIATVTWDPSGFNKVIASANEAGIPVIGFNMDAEGCGTAAFIGQDFVDSGYQLGKYIFGEQLKGEGQYIIASCAPADTALIARAEGLEKAAAEYPGIELIEIIDIGTDLTNAYGVIENAYLANPEVDAIIGVDVFSEAIGSFIAAQGLKDTVAAGGYDLTEGALKHVANGDMDVTVGQNPFLQGYYSVIELYNHLENGADMIDMNTGAQLVTIDNVDSVEAE